MTRPSVYLSGFVDDLRTGGQNGMTPADVAALIVGLDLIAQRVRVMERTAEERDAQDAEEARQVRLAEARAEEAALDGIHVIPLGADTSMAALMAALGSALGEGS